MPREVCREILDESKGPLLEHAVMLANHKHRIEDVRQLTTRTLLARNADIYGCILVCVWYLCAHTPYCAGRDAKLQQNNGHMFSALRIHIS